MEGWTAEKARGRLRESISESIRERERRRGGGKSREVSCWKERGRDVKAERMGKGGKGTEKGTGRGRNKIIVFCQYFVKKNSNFSFKRNITILRSSIYPQT